MSANRDMTQREFDAACKRRGFTRGNGETDFSTTGEFSMPMSAQDLIDRGVSQFEAEIERLQDRIGDLGGEIDHLKSVINDLESQLADATSGSVE